MVEDWTAVYLPAQEEDEEPRTCIGFPSERKAEKYAERYFCSSCRSLLAKALKTEHNGTRLTEEEYWEIWSKDKPKPKNDEEETEQNIEFYSDYAHEYGEFGGDACGAEWVFMPTEEFEKCENFGDIMKAVGFEEQQKGQENEDIPDK